LVISGGLNARPNQQMTSHLIILDFRIDNSFVLIGLIIKNQVMIMKSLFFSLAFGDPQFIETGGCGSVVWAYTVGSFNTPVEREI